MATFKEVYCRKFACPPADFERRVFRAAAYPHVRLLALLGLSRIDHFSPDRALIAYCGMLHSTRQVADEVRDFATLAENRRFLRRVLRLRVSGRRLQRVAATCVVGVRRSSNGQSAAPFSAECPAKRAA